MLIDLTNKDVRIDPGLFPQSLVVAVLNGSVHHKPADPPNPRFRKISEPDYRGAAGEGAIIKAFRLKADVEPTFRDPGETGWEYRAATYDREGSSENHLITLVREERDGNLSWVLWHNSRGAVFRTTIVIPDFDLHDDTPIVLDPLRHIAVPKPPTAWERLGADDL